MRCKSFWQRLVTFSLTFLFSVCLSNWFILSEQQILEPEQIQPENEQKVAPVTIRKLSNNFIEPKCRRYDDYGKRAELIRARAKAIVLFKQIKTASRKDEKYLRREFRELERKIDRLEEINKGRRFTRQESDALHNLLYIENCAEY